VYVTDIALHQTLVISPTHPPHVPFSLCYISRLQTKAWIHVI